MPDIYRFNILRVRLFWTTVILSIGVLAAFVLAAWTFESSHNATCESQNRSNTAIRRVLELAHQISVQRHDGSPEERQANFEFYTRALRLVAPINCS